MRAQSRRTTRTRFQSAFSHSGRDNHGPSSPFQPQYFTQTLPTHPSSPQIPPSTHARPITSHPPPTSSSASTPASPSPRTTPSTSTPSSPIRLLPSLVLRFRRIVDEQCVEGKRIRQDNVAHGGAADGDGIQCEGVAAAGCEFDCAEGGDGGDGSIDDGAWGVSMYICRGEKGEVDVEEGCERLGVGSAVGSGVDALFRE